MKTGTGVQARLCLSNLRDCNVGIIDERFMKYAVQMGSGAMIYKPSFIKTGSGIQTLLGDITYIDTMTHRQQGDLTSLFYFLIAGKV
jgi:hypothetical protein